MMQHFGTGDTLLIVDDDRDLLPSLEAMLETLTDFTVVTAQNGAIGLERFYEVRPQCVIIDVKMPELDGYQLVRALRGDPETAATPLIILTAMAQDQNRLAGLVSGVDQYLIKPVTPRDLIAAIQMSLQTTHDERLLHLRQLVEADSSAE
jgi:DNA-binding response OmpR family regulator